MLRGITINTDASFHPQLKVGGYAFWIVCDLFRITKAGKFKSEPKTPLHAEMMCIGNSLATLIAQKELPRCSWIVINTDCKQAILRIEKPRDEFDRQIKHLLDSLHQKIGAKIEFRHVRAHTKATDARSFVNDWCDKEAKKYMGKAADEKRKLLLRNETT